MNWVRLVAGVIVAAWVTAGCGGKSGPSPEGAEQSGSGARSSNDNPDPAVCVVMGEPIDGATFYELDGKTYAFCCESCIDKFKADPQKYLAGK